MKNRIVLISGVIAALVPDSFSGVSLPEKQPIILAVVAICVTFAVLALAIPANLFSWLRGKKGKPGFIKSTFIGILRRGNNEWRSGKVG